MRIIMFFLSCLSISNVIHAQWSAEVILTGGDFNLRTESYDGRGFSMGIGIAPAYDFGGRWGLFRLEISVESFSGIQLPSVVNQLVDVPAYADVPISVSHRTTITGLTAYRAVLASEIPLFARIPRLQFTSGIGIFIDGNTRSSREVFAQTIENIPLSPEQAATFSERDGEIVQASFEALDFTNTSALFSVGLSYTLVERVRVFASRESRYFPWRGGSGLSDFWRVGVAGKIWAGSQAEASPRRR